MTRVGLFGGSFNPIHHGHRLTALAAAERLDLRPMILIPAGRPPHKTEVADGAHRLEMVRLAISGMPGFEVSDLELTRPGRSYTLHTVQAMRDRFPGAELFWLIGADTLADLTSWYRLEELADLCTFATVGRPGFDVSAALAKLRTRLTGPQVDRIAAHVLEGVPLVELSASDIRARVASGRPIDWHVPAAVAGYIAEKGLYPRGS
jgi:nicotinate-nucleotide adenylyltransferase